MGEAEAVTGFPPGLSRPRRAACKILHLGAKAGHGCLDRCGGVVRSQGARQQFGRLAVLASFPQVRPDGQKSRANAGGRQSAVI
jgi:hypothetical protein